MARTRKFGDSYESVQSLTQQQFKDECDANRIVSQYRNTGVMPMPGPRPPVANYGDFTSAPDFMEAQNIVLRAREQFDALPVKVRDRFNYDPARFLEFVADPKNLDQAHELGLLSDEAVQRREAAKKAAVPAPGEAPK